MQLLKLFKERSRKIKVTPKVLRIPSISPPNIVIINRKDRLWSIHRNYLLPCRRTLSMIQTPLIPPGNPPLLTTIRTHSRSRNLILLTTINRRNLTQKIKITLRYFIPFSAIFTFIFHTPSIPHPQPLENLTKYMVNHSPLIKTMETPEGPEELKQPETTTPPPTPSQFP